MEHIQIPESKLKAQHFELQLTENISNFHNSVCSWKAFSWDLKKDYYTGCRVYTSFQDFKNLEKLTLHLMIRYCSLIGQCSSSSQIFPTTLNGSLKRR